MKKIVKRLIPAVVFSFALNAEALVDYSETATGPAANKSATRLQSPRVESQSGLIWKSNFSLAANYEATEINSEKMGILNFNTHLQTPFNVFFDLNYWQTQSKSGPQKGNPKIILGFNWLRFGSPAEEARLDLYGGARLQGQSEMASSRTDKIVGVETTKRFGTFGLGIGYDLTMTGTPKKSTDLGLGSIQRIALSGGWMVSNDIQFEVELENFKVNAAKDSSRANRLTEAASFSTLSPKLNLTIVPSMTLELGARFRTNRAKTNQQQFSQAKLFDLHGAYSNSLFAGLSFNI
jgi:hypothetical protein